MDDVTQLRLRLLENGYTPIPVIGKHILPSEWTTMTVDRAAIASEEWQRYPNTGGRNAYNPGLDADIMDGAAAAAAEDLARERFGDRGTWLVRFGLAPKRTILFRTDTPFPKLIRKLVAPNGTKARIEFLCDGQQTVLFGIHPGTRKPYSWHGGRDPSNVPRDDLPDIAGAEAEQLVGDIATMLINQFGYRPDEDDDAPKSNGHDKGHTNGKVDVEALVATMAKGNCNEVQKRVIPALIWRGWHPDEVRDYLVEPALKAWGGTRAERIKFITQRMKSAIKNLFMKDYDHTDGVIPPWLAAEFHNEWADVLARKQRPELCYERGKWAVRSVMTGTKGDAAAEQPKAPPPIPLTIAEWRARHLPPPDRLLGAWFTTTSRVLMSADTGLGKTNLGMTIAVHVGAGVRFLHWEAYRPARVLYIDGEMSRRLYRDRINDAARRLGQDPQTVLFLSREDIEDFAPLNTPKGAAWLNQLLERIGPIDAIIFDNIMALLDGDMKEEEGWTRILPLVNSLTKRCIGQLWINHTGHDASRSYGSHTKTWRMDTVMHLAAVERADTDLSFTLEFHKARERTPDNREDFEEATIALVDDVWTCSSGAVRRKGKPSAQEISVLEVLTTVLAGADAKTIRGRRCVPTKPWCDECVRRALVKGEDAFRSCRSRLAQKRLVECEGEWTWMG